MNYKLKGNTMLNADIISPDMPVAEFSAGLGPDVKHKLVATMNAGDEMLSIYREHRENFHIANLMKMLEKMEDVFLKFDAKMYEIKRDF